MLKAAGRFGAIGLEIFFAIVIGFIAGYYLDQYLNTNPWFTVIFTIFGVVAAVRALIRVSREYKAQIK